MTYHSQCPSLNIIMSTVLNNDDAIITCYASYVVCLTQYSIVWELYLSIQFDTFSDGDGVFRSEI